MPQNEPTNAAPVNLESAPLVRSSNVTSIFLNRVAKPRATAVPTLGGFMSDPATAAATGLLAKLLPAGVGAALMIAVDTPKTRREWFLRIFVAFVCSWAFYGFTFDLLHSISWFSFLDKTNEDHQFAVRALLGATGWFLLGAASMVLKKLRTDPVATLEEVKKVAP